MGSWRGKTRDGPLPRPLPHCVGEGIKNSFSLKGAGLGRGARNHHETLAGLRLTGYFLAHWLLEPHGKKLPAARARLVDIIKESVREDEKTPA